MTLAGTRPILQDELLKYELHHRARIAIKPGITGMWQVSGRSDIKPVGHYNFKKHLKAIVVFFAMSCATTIYTHLDTVMLGFIRTDVDVGYYNAAVKIKTILVSIVTSLGVVLLPIVFFGVYFLILTIAKESLVIEIENQLLEMLQLLMRLGTFQLSDIFYNTVGGVLGGLMYCAVMKVRKRL